MILDLHVYGGAALVAVGMGLWALPAGLVAGGILLIFIGRYG